jgi:hypothetical protein
MRRMYCAGACRCAHPAWLRVPCIPLVSSCLSRLASCACTQPAPVIALTFLMAT